MRGHAIGALVMVVLAGEGGPVFAQSDGGVPSDAGGVDGFAGDGGAPPDVVEAPSPPVLLAPVVADHPPAARAAGLEGSVVVKVDIDAEGQVTEAVVVRPAGDGFDEAARAAALGARFRPARRGGRAVPSRIALRIEFRLPPAPPRRTPAAQAPLDVTVRGESLIARKLHSAEAVTIVDTERAKRQSADMGEVLARTEGVSVRQQGGLGSFTRISINGLIDEQVRYFLDGVPLELMGYPFGIANVPVNLVERVEIYKGVLPIRFAADALGGAFNLVSDQDLHGKRVAFSYKVGSFDTHRLTLTARYLHAPSGFLVRAAAFHDYALNDYRVNVDVPDAEGQLSPARVYRFHDEYRATGANVELGFVERPWAKRLVLRAFVTDYDKDYQHNYVMTVPYGAITYGELMAGASLRYEQKFGARLALEVVGAYAYSRGRYRDLSTCVFDWYGRCVRRRPMPGELDGHPYDSVFFSHRDYLRAYLTWRPAAWQSVRLALMPPRFDTRTGDNRWDDTVDKLNSVRRLITMINGVEHQVDLLDGRLENIAFGKQYLQILDADEVNAIGPDHRRRDTVRFGVGDGLRYRFGHSLWVKASYEWATRLPRADEVFGDNAFQLPNSELRPESSHNGNLGFQYDRRGTRLGGLNAHVNAFARLSKDLIVLIRNNQTAIYRNVYGARSIGVEGKVGWTSPRDLLVLEANFTWQDFRNDSTQGAFGAFAGDRIPNRPYLDGNGMARLQLRDAIAPRDEISLYWNARYVHSFFKSWESIGQREYKQVIPTQLVHSAGASYFIRNDGTLLSVDVELQNVTDEVVYDFFGTQRPGRAAFFKTTAAF